MKYKQLKGLVLVFILMGNSLTALAQKATTRHEIQMGETLYSLSRKYGVSVDAIRKANPSMGDLLLAGQVITIPTTTIRPTVSNPSEPAAKGNCKQMYLVEKKETIYGISRKFNLTEEELLNANPQIRKSKLKKGEYICIPYSDKEITDRQEEIKQGTEAQQLIIEEKKHKAQMFDKINVAVILPFSLDSNQKSNEAIKMIDFYEGFLLAVDDLKSRGISVDIYAYEEKNSAFSNIDSILAQPMMPHMNLIVGPMHAENIPAVSQFARRHNIPMTVPFSSRTSVTQAAPTVYQVNTQASLLYDKVYEQFIARNSNVHIVFVNSADRNEKPDFVAGFKTALQNSGMTYSTTELGELSNLPAIVPESDKKIVCIPSSSSQSAFENMVKKLNANTGIDTYSITLFGYPEWQTFSDKNKQNMNKYHASFFTSFYTNTSSSDVQAFNKKFNYWFKRDQFNSYPLYGLLGHDIAQYFIAGLHAYGTSFASNQAAISIPALQNPMRFEQENPQQGFINTYIRIISF